jgi:hypothetical protein
VAGASPATYAASAARHRAESAKSRIAMGSHEQISRAKMAKIEFASISSSEVTLAAEKIADSPIKMGLGISRTNADSQWNPVYNVFHRNFCCGNETIRR